MRVSGLFVYPVKGARAIACDEVSLTARGPENDRRWIITDESGKFITQRECGALARLIAKAEGGALWLSMKGAGEILADIPETPVRADIRVWNSVVNAADMGDGAAAFLSEALGLPARLFFMDDRAHRDTSGNWGEPGPVSFADGYPLLITNTASLAALNEEIERRGGFAIGMERFRPNIVIDHHEPWAEDCWRELKIGNAVIELCKPCVRCVVTTKDQMTGERVNKEPLASLARLRRSKDPRLNGVTFGWNAFVRREGRVSAGDAAELL